MGAAFDRDQLLGAFDRIGQVAAAAGSRLELAIYGGSALILASNFRFSTEDVDIAYLEHPWPDWLTAALGEIARRNNWSEDWFNDAVEFHLSPLADRASDHVEFGTFPRDETPVGLVVSVPTAPYLLALKLKAIRINDPAKGEIEARDIRQLMRVVGCRSADDAIAVLARYFPASAAASEKQRFLLRHIGDFGDDDAPEYPRRSG
jgi:hypothetical protein